MATQSGNSTNDTVVGVFMDETQAKAAIQSLQSAGYKARIADSSALKAFRTAGWEDEIISTYESRMNQGNSIVTVDASDKGDQVLGMMLQQGADYVNLSGSKGGADKATEQTMRQREVVTGQSEHARREENLGRNQRDGEARVQLRDETLSATKQSVQAGEVGLHKVVHERQEEVPVTLRHEEVFVERHAVDRPLQPGEKIDMTDETIQVPVYGEQATLQKQTRVREEVSLGKKAVEEQQNLVGTVKSEDVEVTQTGDVRVTGEGQSSTARTSETETTRKNK